MILIIILFVNCVIYGFGIGFFFVALSFLISVKPTAWPAWFKSVRTRFAVAVCLTIAIAIIFPAHENAARHRRREEARRADVLRTERLENVHQLAILYNPSSLQRQTGGIMDGNYQELERWQSLLLSHAVDGVLIGRDAEFGGNLDPATSVIRYRIGRRPWCEPIQLKDRSGRSDLDALARLASGTCLISEKDNLGDADTVVAVEFLPNDGPRSFHRHDEDVTANRIALYQRDGVMFRLVSQETHVGGSDWFVPVVYGSSGIGFVPSMIFGGGADFLTMNNRDPIPPDIHTRFLQWGLSAEDQIKLSEDVMRQTAKLVLDRSDIPEDSAVNDFLGAYLFNKAWNDPDRSLAAAIIRNPNVTRFPFDGPSTKTPGDLARPIAERMLATDLSPSMTSAKLSSSRYVVQRMAGLIQLLPACASLSARDLIEQADHDAARHVLVASAVRMVELDLRDARCRK